MSPSFLEADAFLLFDGLMSQLGQLYAGNDVYDEPPAEGLPPDAVAEHVLARHKCVRPVMMCVCMCLSVYVCNE